MVMYDAHFDVYYVEAPSDSDPRTTYDVAFHPSTGNLTCECPSFQFSRGESKNCKHIRRYGQEIIDQYNHSVYSEPDPGDNPDEIELFTITLNSNNDVVGDRAMVEWLLTAINPGDELVIYRR